MARSKRDVNRPVTGTACRPLAPSASRSARVDNAARDGVPDTSGTGLRN
ncbi:hypothetical protein [Streptomyces sp. NRRL S-118]|nr:hypothetical protein [Streptomyces sp. NRRL S-118]